MSDRGTGMDAARSFDLIVIGAGINGAAIAREAALLGLSVLLIEARDVASGTTAASTRLIHGGLRYLEHFEIGLVYESLAERERLLRTAPHLVTPLKFHLPLYSRGRRAKWQIRAGLLLYDLLSWHKSLPRREILSRDELVGRLPGIETAGLVGGASYYDAQVRFPERLTLELVLDAMSQGAELMTHTEVTEIVVTEGRARAVRWRDAAGMQGSARATVIVNAAGPWVDRVNGRAGARRLIGGTRGSHLVVAPFAGAPETAIYLEAVSDGRPFFVVPWNGLFLVGTTDERFEEDPGAVEASESEVRYLLEETSRAFPRAGGLAAKVLYTYSGVRPLPHAPRAAEGAITRRHAIRHHRGARGLYSIVGGKLTTHRALAVDALKRLRRWFPEMPSGSRTATRALPGALDANARTELSTEIAGTAGAEQAARWWSIYGGASTALLERAREAPELAASIVEGELPIAAELVHALECEHAATLADILQRRCMAGLDARFGLGIAKAAAERLVELGFWDREQGRAELADYLELAARHRARESARPVLVG